MRTKSYHVDLNLELPNGKILKDLIVNMDNFDVISALGKGTFGIVSLVREKSTGKKYASKALKPLSDDVDNKQEKLFKREVEIMATYNHYALLGFRGFTEFKKNSLSYILTEYCEKLELSKLILSETNGTAPHEYDDTQKFIIAYGIACGMQYLHKNHIIHRDIKPENIFLNESFEPKVADFGLSKKLEGTIYQSETVGTPLFMAPELLEEKEYSYPVDVYAYGMVLYNIFTLESPFHYLGSQVFKLTQLVIAGERPQFLFDIPFYQDLIIKCWDQNPEKRPSFDQIVEELNAIIDSPDVLDLSIDIIEDYKDKLLQKESQVLRSPGSKRTRQKPKRQLTIIEKLREAANNGNIASQIDLANRYQKGEGVKQDFKKAVAYFKKAAKNGDIGAMVKYGVCLLEGEGVDNHNREEAEENYKKAAKYFEKTIERGQDENAMYYYSLQLLEGKGVEKDTEKAIYYLKNAADLHQADAENKYGMMLEFGSKEVKKNVKEAIKYYRKSSDHGNEVGMFNYADILEKGKHVEQNVKEAARLFRLSYKRGYIPAICRYGEMLLEGRGVDADPNEASRLFLLAIQNKYTSAYVSLGQMYLTGNGFDKNEEEATRLFKMAADAGNVRGMIQYGISLEEGIGCKKDVVKALELYKKSIAKGSKIALTKAAKLLLLGEDGVDEDLETAIDYLSTAKENGDEEAASILAELNDE